MGEVVAGSALPGHPIAELSGFLPVRGRADLDVLLRGVIGEDAVHHPSGRGIGDALHPEVAHVLLRPVEGGDVAVLIAVVAQGDHLARLVAQEAVHAPRLSRLHHAVEVVEVEVEHAVVVEDAGELRLQLLDAPENVLDLVLDVARGRPLRRRLARARRVPCTAVHARCVMRSSRAGSSDQDLKRITCCIDLAGQSRISGQSRARTSSSRSHFSIVTIWCFASCATASSP